MIKKNIFKFPQHTKTRGRQLQNTEIMYSYGSMEEGTVVQAKT